VTGDEVSVTGTRESCVVNRTSYVCENLRLCVPVFIFSVVGNYVSQILTIHLNCQLIQIYA
jgi:hypothetical protein